MSDLTNLEKRKFERLLGMGSGYVLDFSNRTFDEFVTDTVGRNIYDSKYDGLGTSKANRLRAFSQTEPNYVVAKLMGPLLDYQKEVEDRNQISDNFYLKKKPEELQQSASLREERQRIVARLLQSRAARKSKRSPPFQMKETSKWSPGPFETQSRRTNPRAASTGCTRSSSIRSNALPRPRPSDYTGQTAP